MKGDFMNRGRIFRILLFAGLVIGLLFSRVCVSDNQAKPLLDENIGLTKTGAPTTFTQAGDTITYTYVVTNKSNRSLTGVSVSDDLVDVSCPSKIIAYSGQMTCTGTYVITEEDVENGEVVNQATVDATIAIPKEGCCSCGNDYYYPTASASFSVALEELAAIPETPAISLDKTGSPASFTGPEETITYSYTVTNTGNIPLSGPVTVTDDKVDVTCPSGGLDVGASMDCSASYTTTLEDVAAGSVTNNATASAVGVTADDSFTVELVANPALSLTKSADPTSFTKENTLIIYSFAVTNTGNVPIGDPFELNDPMLDEWTCPSQVLQPGDALSCTGYYRIRAFDTGNTVNNCASVTGYYIGNAVTSSEACTDIYYQPPRERPRPEPEPSACDLNPSSWDCYCEQYPEDPECTEGPPQ
jgi:uncharacterized repeat protein (TIGR01451 family)